MISGLISDSNFVEPAGVEPASKHMPDKLSTCLSRNWISGIGRNRANQLHPYTALVSSRKRSNYETILLIVELGGRDVNRPKSSAAKMVALI